MLTESTQRKIVDQDRALTRSIGLIGGELLMAPFDKRTRERVVLRRLLIDASRERNFLVGLRPLAYGLEAGLDDARERGDDPVPVALAALKSLTWVADSLSERLTSDFT